MALGGVRTRDLAVLLHKSYPHCHCHSAIWADSKWFKLHFCKKWTRPTIKKDPDPAMNQPRGFPSSSNSQCDWRSWLEVSERKKQPQFLTETEGWWSGWWHTVEKNLKYSWPLKKMCKAFQHSEQNLNSRRRNEFQQKNWEGGWRTVE